MSRPTGVTIIAILAAINGAIATIAGGANLLNVKLPYLGELQAQYTGIATLVIGIVWLAIAWGFWSGGNWARLLGVVWSGLSILVAAWVLVTHLNALSTILVPVVASVLLPLIIFWYLRKDDVRAFFGA